MSSLEVVQQRIIRSTAELDLSYSRSPLSGEHHGEAPGDARTAFAQGPRPGERTPFGHAIDGRSGKAGLLSDFIDGRQHTLLLFEGRKGSPQVRAHLAGTALGMAHSRAGVVRPVVVVASREHPLFDGPIGIADLCRYRWVLPSTAVSSRNKGGLRLERQSCPDTCAMPICARVHAARGSKP